MACGTSFNVAELEISVDNGSTWTDITGAFNQMTPSGGDVAFSEFFAGGGADVCLTFGPQSSVGLQANILYTEVASDAYDLVATAYEAGTEQVKLQWRPTGTGAGKYEFESDDNGRIITAPWPGGDTSSADATQLAFTVQATGVTRSTQV